MSNRNKYLLGCKKLKGASAVKLLRPLELNRKVLTLPGSICREHNPVVHRRQSNSRFIPVKICGGCASERLKMKAPAELLASCSTSGVPPLV